MNRALISTLVFLLPLAATADVVVSQVFGGGGNSGAPYDRDFVELFNAGTEPVVVDDWSLQYATASGTSWQATPLAGTLAPGAYLLVGQALGAGNGQPLPAVDVDGVIPMAAGAGKIALVRALGILAGACPESALIVDFVGYGTANCFEGSGAVTALGNATAAVRRDGGCADSDDNATDFVVAAPQPRHGGSATLACGVAASPTATHSPAPIVSPTLTPTPPSTATPTPTASPSASASPSPPPSPTAIPSASATRTATITASPTGTATATATDTASATSSPTFSVPPTFTPSATSTPSPALPTPSPTHAAATATASATPALPVSPTPGVASCGDGVLDPGEHCDDGNRDSADLCPSAPGDDCLFTGAGKLAFGDPRVRRVRRHGCWLGWHVVQAKAPDLRRGLPKERQACDDQEVGCDFDPQPGVCEFRVVACLNVVTADLPDCAPVPIGELTIVAPRPQRAARDTSAPPSALADALGALAKPSAPEGGHGHAPPLTADDVDLCSQPFAVRITLDGAARRSQKLAVRARVGERGGVGLYSRLRLTCRQ